MMYDEADVSTIRRFLIDGIFHTKIGISVFEDAIALLNTFSDSDFQKQQVNEIIEKYKIFDLFALLELKMKYPAIPMRHNGEPAKFVDLYKELAKARQLLKIIIARFLSRKEIDIEKPEIATGKEWVTEVPSISELPEDIERP